MSPRTTEHLTWHQSHDAVDGVMVHPSDGEPWKHFNSVHPHFLAESRNVRLGLCTDGFNPFRSFVAPYSCWPVILTVYNLQRRWDGICCRFNSVHPFRDLLPKGIWDALTEISHFFRNMGCTHGEVPSSGNLSIFSNTGRPTPKNVVRGRYLSEIEFKQAHNYVLFNCDELRPFIQ